MNNSRIELITRADDCGSSLTANQAIMEAYRQGIVKNISLMVNCDAIEDAAERFSAEKDVCFGIHTTLNAEWDTVRWGPILPRDQVPSLVDQMGYFHQTTAALHASKPKLNEIMAELQAQLDKARRLGFDIKYADAHMGYEWTVDGLSEQFDLWCRREGILNHRNYSHALPKVDFEGDPVETFIHRLGAAEPGQYLVVAHPGYDNEEMRMLGHDGFPGVTVAVERHWERLLFMDPRIVEYCRDHQVRAIRYDEAVLIG